MKVSEMQGAALDWAVAKCEGVELDRNGLHNLLLVYGHMSKGQEMLAPYRPSTNWAQGGPIIEREEIQVGPAHNDWHEWRADCYKLDPACVQYGPTPLVAAMRCYVASKLGYDIDVPEELS